MRRRLLAVPLVVAVLAACSPAASDADGEVFVPGPMTPAAEKRPDAVPVVVDTDLAPDDLAALALLLRHPGVRVVGITVPQTGQLDCRGIGLLTDFFDALATDPPPVSCGTTPRGDEGVQFPPEWGAGAMLTSGLPREAANADLTPVDTPAAELITRLARRHDDLRIVALAPLTEVAAVLRRHPSAYSRIDGIVTMAGSVRSASHASGVAEWNAGADPVPLAEVLAGPVPVTVVPDDPVPPGAPAGLAGPVVGGLGRVPHFESPKYWDLATAGVLVAGSAATTTDQGAWTVDTDRDRGRLRRTGDGTVQVVTDLDAEALDEVYRSVFG
ncbi:MAG TPA: nucleoside hydrolase [Nocardioides sp.]|nr:nucleoside hydrolase [Nocardioides sp.]